MSAGSVPWLVSYQEVEGVAQLEKRRTVVPLSFCETGPCYPSEQYWILVLRTPEGRFELNERLAVGEKQAPAEVTLAGARVEAGSRIRVEAKVLHISPSYSLISDVQKVEVQESNDSLKVE